MSKTSKPAVTPEMVEKARQSCPNRQVEGHNSAWNCQACTYAAEFAASAVQDAVSGLEPFLQHGPDCSHYHAWNERNRRCDCGLAALREKYGVKP